MRFEYCITMATDIPSEYVTLTAFPRQKWLHEHTSLLHLYVTYLVRLDFRVQSIHPVAKISGKVTAIWYVRCRPVAVSGSEDHAVHIPMT